MSKIFYTFHWTDDENISKNKGLVERLKAAGFNVRGHHSQPESIATLAYTEYFSLICVYPTGGATGEWYSFDECERLLRGEKFTPEPVYDEPYTDADAKRDAANEKTRLKQDYKDGKISLEDLSIGLSVADKGW